MSLLIVAVSLTPAQSQSVTRATLNAYFTELIQTGQPLEYPNLTIDASSKVGHIGILSTRTLSVGRRRLGVSTLGSMLSVKLVEKLDDNTALITSYTSQNAENRAMVVGSFDNVAGRSSQLLSENEFFILKSTEIYDLQENATLFLKEHYEITGKKDHLGTDLFLIEQVQLPALPAYPEAIGLSARTWSDTTGKFSREGTYLSYDKGKVTIQLPEGKIIQVEMPKLDSVSQTFVRKHIKFAADAKKAEALKLRLEQAGQ